MVHRIIRNLALAFMLTGFLTSCYYDNEEELYPGQAICDTSNVSYLNDIQPVLTSNCNACHSGASPQAGIRTDNYTDLMIIVNDGRFQGAVNHEDGFSPMPQNAPQLDECSLAKINRWIADGANNN